MPITAENPEESRGSLSSPRDAVPETGVDDEPFDDEARLILGLRFECSSLAEVAERAGCTEEHAEAVIRRSVTEFLRDA